MFLEYFMLHCNVSWLENDTRNIKSISTKCEVDLNSVYFMTINIHKFILGFYTDIVEVVQQKHHPKWSWILHDIPSRVEEKVFLWKSTCNFYVHRILTRYFFTLLWSRRM